MGPPSYMRSVVGRNVVMWRIPVLMLVNVILTITPIHFILIRHSMHGLCSKEAHAWYRHLKT